MLKNVQEAKFHTVLEPIARLALVEEAQRSVGFDAFFSHILLHELMHGLGPHEINVGGRSTTVRRELRDAYSAVEEAKADVSGLWALQRLVDQGHIAPELGRSMYSTVLASMFRSLRFGITEAHGRGVAIQLNHFLDRGAVRVAADGRFDVDRDAIRGAVTTLTAEILTLQAEGSYDKAQALIARLGVLRPEVKTVLDRLRDIPVDLEPRFVTAETL